MCLVATILDGTDIRCWIIYTIALKPNYRISYGEHPLLKGFIFLNPIHFSRKTIWYLVRTFSKQAEVSIYILLCNMVPRIILFFGCKSLKNYAYPSPSILLFLINRTILAVYKVFSFPTRLICIFPVWNWFSYKGFLIKFESNEWLLDIDIPWNGIANI